MGEARKKSQRQSGRPWAKGAIKVMANAVECFNWSGTRQDAVDLQGRYLDTVDGAGLDAKSYAKRAAGYLMAFGPPKIGEPRLTPTGFGKPWDSADVDLHRIAVLWLALREHVPDTGKKVEDIFVDKELVIMFTGDKQQILAETEREINGQPFTDEQFQMMVGVLNDEHRLDPHEAVGVRMANLIALAKRPSLEDRGDELIYVPRIPRDAAEADAMLRLLTVFVDTTAPGAETPDDAIRTYAGYTNAELRRGKPAVIVR